MFVDSKLLIFLSFGTFNTVLRDVNGKEGDIFRLESFQFLLGERRKQVLSFTLESNTAGFTLFILKNHAKMRGFTLRTGVNK